MRWASDLEGYASLIVNNIEIMDLEALVEVAFSTGSHQQRTQCHNEIAGYEYTLA